jgi:hypothetical protein
VERLAGSEDGRELGRDLNRCDGFFRMDRVATRRDLEYPKEREQGNSQTVASALCHSILQRISPVYALHASILLEKVIPGSSGG